MSVNLSIHSTLGALTIISLVAWLAGEAYEIIPVVNIAKPVFIVCFAIWLIYIFLSILRNIKGL